MHGQWIELEVLIAVLSRIKEFSYLLRIERKHQFCRSSSSDTEMYVVCCVYLAVQVESVV